MNDQPRAKLSEAHTLVVRQLTPICIFVFAIFSFVRSPSIFLHPRLWAEEGVLYFQQMQHLGWLDAIIFTANNNYQSLVNILVALSIAVPLAIAPVVTTYGSVILAAALPYSLARAARDNGSDPVAAILAAAVLASVGMSFEIFGSATNIQWYGGATMFFVLFWQFKNPQPTPVFLIFVFLYGFSGIPAAMLFPAFFVVGAARKSPVHLVVGAVLAAATTVQIATMLSSPIVTRSFDHRLDILLFPTMLQSILGLWLTPSITSTMGTAMRTLDDKVCIAVVSVLMLWLPLRVAGKARTIVGFALLVGFCASVTQTLGAGGDATELLRPVSGGRYYFISTCAVVAALIFASRSSPRYCQIPLLAALIINVAVWYSGEWVGFTQGASWMEAASRCHEKICAMPVWPGLQMTVERD